MTQSGNVVIVGAGPTGLSLALFLAKSGIRSTLIEKNDAPQFHPAACILDTRTMEVFREINLADTILERCQPIFERADITWVTSLAGRELGRCSALPDDIDGLLSLSPVHATHYPQNRLEPLLWERIRAEPLIDFRPATECLGVEERDAGMVALLYGSGKPDAVTGDYVVACDGASGGLRRRLGIGMDGRVLQHMIGIYFTADLGSWVNYRKSILYWIMNPQVLGVLIAHWLPEEWVLFAPYFPPQQSADEFTPERCEQLVTAAVGLRPKDLCVRLVRPWTLAANLATAYRAGRAFLAGDAAHAFPPTGGLGLNTGVQDAHNLAWKLAAVLTGKAGPALLDSYESERRPVAKANLDHSESNFWNMSALTRPVGLDLGRLKLLRAVQRSVPFRGLPPAWQRTALDLALRRELGKLGRLSENSARGARAREGFAEEIPRQVRHYRFVGLDLGFTYERGAFISDGTPKPVAHDPVMAYRPTTWPSARLPHFWVKRGAARVSILDVVAGDTFTLFTHDAGKGAWRAALEAIAAKVPMPIRLYGIGPNAEADLIDETGAWLSLSEVGPNGAVLVRPDGHVAWRVRSLPESPAEELEFLMTRLLAVDSSRNHETRNANLPMF